MLPLIPFLSKNAKQITWSIVVIVPVAFVFALIDILIEG